MPVLNTKKVLFCTGGFFLAISVFGSIYCFATGSYSDENASNVQTTSGGTVFPHLIQKMNQTQENHPPKTQKEAIKEEEKNKEAEKESPKKDAQESSKKADQPDITVVEEIPKVDGIPIPPKALPINPASHNLPKALKRSSAEERAKKDPKKATKDEMFAELLKKGAEKIEKIQKNPEMISKIDKELEKKRKENIKTFIDAENMNNFNVELLNKYKKAPLETKSDDDDDEWK